MSARDMILLAVSAAAWMLPAPAQAEDIAIVGATVHTEPGTVIEQATVLIRDGRVSAVGKDVAVPAGAQRIDGAGKVVTAGFIEASSRLGLTEVALEESTREGSFNGKDGDHVHAGYRAIDGYNPSSVAIPVTRAAGITSTISTPQGGLLSGVGGWFSLGEGLASDQIVVAPAVAMYASFGEASLASASGSRGVAVERLREILDDAGEYNRRRREHARNQTRPFAVERLDLEALVPVVQGRLPLVVRAHRSSDILAAVRLARETGVRVIIEGGSEAWMVAPELAAARIGVLLSPADNVPEDFDRIHVRGDAAKVLADAGVPVVISTLGGGAHARRLRQIAGMAVARGLRHDQALAAVTTAPAELFGVDRGRIRPGAVADVVVWSGDPFELSTRAEHVIIGGVAQSTRSRQTLLLERYRRVPTARPAQPAR